MARIYYKTVFSGHGGRERGDRIGVTQNSLTTDLVFNCFFEDGETRLFEAGDAVTALFRDVSDGDEYISAGTFTPDIGTNQFTWVQDDTDVGTPGDYRLAFEVTGSTPAISILVDYSIEKVPNGTISPMSPLVGISIAERAWLVLAIADNPTPATWMPKASAFVTAGATYTTLVADGAKTVNCPMLCAVTLADGINSGFQQVFNRTGSGAVTITAATTLQELVADTGLTTIASATLETTAVLLHLGGDVWLITGDYS